MSKVRTQLSKIDDYSAYLESCWQKHLAKREPDAPTVISTFAGCGGSSLGYSMAGFRELLAIEWDDNAVETFKLNFPDVPVYHGDIAKCSVEWILEKTGLVPGQLDILDGSPPCQGFSTSGKREFDDSRNQLYKEYIRLLKGLQPKVFVMENVSGMVKGKMKLIFAEIMKELKAAGYKVSARLMNTMWFGVPQSRQRMIFIGVRNDLTAEPSHPRAETMPMSVAKAVVNCDNYDVPAFDDKYADMWNKIPPGKNATFITGTGKGYNSCNIPNPNKPSPTLPKMQTGRGYATIAHWSEKRALSISEAKRIGGYPDNYDLYGNYSIRWGLIGNSVPPLFMMAIANHIKTNILKNERKLTEQ